MSDIFYLSQIIADKAKSPLFAIARTGLYPTSDGTIGMTIQEQFGRFVCEIAAWPDHVSAVRALLSNEATVFEYAPARWVVISDDKKFSKTIARVVKDRGSVIDLSHGRTILRLRGEKFVWVLAKLFAVDVSIMNSKTGLATSHHGVAVQIWRADEDIFDIIIFRSFAASFWRTLTRACADVGYQIE